MLLSIAGLDLSFRTVDGPAHVLRGIDLAIAEGERVALVGESGSGKSVTARAIMGLLPGRGMRIEGSILFDGQELLGRGAGRVAALRGRDITMVFQDPTAALNPLFTIRAQFEAVLRRRAAPTEAGMQAALRDVAIADPLRVLDSYAFQLSGGLNQRVMIAMALANNPRLLLADEPGTALDVTVQDQTLRLMRELSAAHGTAILLISHNLGVVRQFADRLYVLYAGGVVEHGRTADIFRAPQHPYTRALLAAVPRLASAELPEGIPGAMADPRRVEQGCAFRPRCPLADARCAQPIPMRRVGAEHHAACIRVEAVHA